MSTPVSEEVVTRIVCEIITQHKVNEKDIFTYITYDSIPNGKTPCYSMGTHSSLKTTVQNMLLALNQGMGTYSRIVTGRKAQKTVYQNY